ncbi:MAG: endonuclease III [Eubacteriales bacterium]|nr:endonuclease III [Eubacteriales bacterium]
MIKITKILEAFDKDYPEAECALHYDDSVQLLVATQLSAQCTDERVNIVTKELFKKYKSARDFAEADEMELQALIKSTGFFRNKAKNIIGCCKMLIEKYGGKVPQTLDEMLKLPGVGRKTANLVLGDIYGIPGIVVDTHVIRLSNRIGFTENKDPVKIEFDLMKIVPEESWSRFCHQMVLHGRAVCNARKPKCGECRIREYCRYGSKVAG